MILFSNHFIRTEEIRIKSEKKKYNEGTLVKIYNFENIISKRKIDKQVTVINNTAWNGVKKKKDYDRKLQNENSTQSGEILHIVYN